MTNSKKAKRFQFWINVVLVLITLSIVLPFVLVFISSLTDENTLIRNGYSIAHLSRCRCRATSGRLPSG